MKKQITKLAPKASLERKKRVAAYARVSTGKDAMRHSLAQQVSYYNDLIHQEPGWSFAGVYADEAYTGTKEERPEFRRLLADCRNGCVDMIITKSISRFARNTVTLLQTVRDLKSMDIDVYFEEQKIHTLSTDGELMLTILASYAQEESKSASDNMKWRIRNSFEQGEIMCLSVLYGYRFDKKDGIVVVPEQAEIVREIYNKVIQGQTLRSIAHWLNGNEHFGALGGKWHATRVRDLISNEKYTGNALLQKRFVNNHIEKKLIRNNGELKQYYATETHLPIIDQQTFDAAQEALARISEHKPNAKSEQHHTFTGFILCPACGKHYKHFLNHGLPRWACATYMMDGKDSCPSRKIPEDVLMRICCEILGCDAFDEGLLRKTVDHITSVYPDELIFHFRDGSEKRTKWEYESRSKSWTPEMKSKAAENAKRRKHG